MPFVIAQPAGSKKPALYRVKQTPKGLIGVVPDYTFYGERVTTEIHAKEVMLHLGDHPPYGTCYGVLVEPIEQRVVASKWGEVFYHVKTPDVVRERIGKAFVVSLAQLRKRGLDGWHPVITEVRNPKGTVTGEYHYKSNGQDRMVIRPMQGQGLREFVKVISHEGGHGVWRRVMTPADRSEWIELHERYTAVQQVSPADVKRMVTAARQIESVRAYLKEADPEDQAAFNIYLGWLKRTHSLSTHDVQDLISAGRRPPVPDTHLHRSSVSTPITLYSKTSPAELFCEALGSSVVGDLADKHILALLKRVGK